jgi:hypothetical protein
MGSWLFFSSPCNSLPCEHGTHPGAHRLVYVRRYTELNASQNLPPNLRGGRRFLGVNGHASQRPRGLAVDFRRAIPDARNSCDNAPSQRPRDCATGDGIEPKPGGLPCCETP